MTAIDLDVWRTRLENTPKERINEEAILGLPGIAAIRADAPHGVLFVRFEKRIDANRIAACELLSAFLPISVAVIWWQERPCRTCSRLNDIDAKSCWWCATRSPGETPG